MRRHVSSARFTLVLLLTTVLALAAFVPPAAAITGGQVDVSNLYSNVGCLVGKWPGSDQLEVFASGTLIHPRVVLTAGHVTWAGQHQPPGEEAWVRFSFGTNAFDPSSWLEIGSSATHPSYNPIPNRSPCDVGAVVLKEPVADVLPAQLPYAGFLDDLQAANQLRLPGEGGVPFTIVGYGATLEWPPPDLTYGDGWRRFTDSSYLNLLPGYLLLHMNAATGDGGFASGDSGGAAFWLRPDGTPVLVGVTDWGTWNATGFCWRVDLPETLDFIQDVIARVDAGLL